jgi:hypothetical protein
MWYIIAIATIVGAYHFYRYLLPVLRWTKDKS